MRAQPWIYSPFVDGAFILAPAFLATAVVLLFPQWAEGPLSLWQWLLLVVCIDVAHVYSTLYRTYFDPETFRTHRTLLIAAPLLCFVAGVGLYALGAEWFWRVAAYLAVYHFVRQQYGFTMLYGRKEDDAPRRWRRLDQVVIYAATLYPLLEWHLRGPRQFDWFLPGDFVYLHQPWLGPVALGVYLLLLGLYLYKEILYVRRFHAWNMPRNLIILGTAISWYVGIVWLNGDAAFTLTNVVAHGVPYMALVWAYGRKKQTSRKRYYAAAIPVFIGLLVALAYLEEGLWDALVWREHGALFGGFYALPPAEALLGVVVPLLAVPQLTHYVVDGFIWRLRRPDWRAGVL